MDDMGETSLVCTSVENERPYFEWVRSDSHSRRALSHGGTFEGSAFEPVDSYRFRHSSRLCDLCFRHLSGLVRQFSLPVARALLFGGQICVMKCSVGREICLEQQLFNYMTHSFPRYTKKGKPAGSAGSAQRQRSMRRIQIGKKDTIVAVGASLGL
jgi:hypothetical protein